MPRVFRLSKDYEIILNPEAIKLVPELATLSKQELRYVILAADYVDSPFRRKPLEERKLMAIKRIWGSVKKKISEVETDKVRLALREYEGLIFDIRRHTIDVYKAKIKDLHLDTLREDLSFPKLKENTSQMEFLQEKIRILEKELDTEEEEQITLKGGKDLSFIEIWQRRQREHRKFYEGRK